MIPCASKMSEVLRNPWLLRSVLDDLSNNLTDQSGLDHLHRTSQLAQIIQVIYIKDKRKKDKPLFVISLYSS